MRLLVVTTGLGEFITEMEVEEHELVGVASEWVRVLPDAGIYLDGHLVSDEARLAMQLAMSARTAQTEAAPAPEPEKIKEYGETLQRVFDDVRKGYVQSLRDLQDCARRFSEMWIEREKQFADEAARQRALTYKSLADVDLLGRSVKAAQLREVLASPVTDRPRGHRSPTMTVADFMAGVLKTITGEK